jgi:hypothetical protein
MDPLPSINKVYSSVVQEESNNESVISLDDSSVLVNASNARKPPNRDKCPSSSKNSNRVCTYCGRNGHTVDFCYAKHGHPNVNKGQASANASHGENLESKFANSVTEVGSSSSSISLTQEKYDQLISLLQQASLVPSAPPTTSIEILSVSSALHDGHSPHDASSKGNPITCSLSSKPTYWLLESEANEHTCTLLCLLIIIKLLVTFVTLPSKRNFPLLLVLFLLVINLSLFILTYGALYLLVLYMVIDIF